MLPIRIKACSESDLRMLGNLARNIQRVVPVTQADIDAAAALGKGWVVWKVIEVNDPIDNLRGGTQLVIKQNSITPGQNVRRVLIVSGPGGETVVIGPGPSPLLLPDAIADSLEYLKAFGGTEQRNLPTGYTQLEYIESTGTQYIDTGIKPNSNTAISIKYYPATNSAFMCLYGTQDSTALNRFYGLISSTQFRVQINSNAGQTPNFWGINTDGTLVANNNGTFAQTQGVVTLGVDNKNKVISVKSDEYTGDISAPDTVMGDNLDCQYNLLLLSRGTAGTATNGFLGRLYSFAVKENDVLIQNLIPAKRNSDNVIGMYDLVSGQFFTNAGTGTFTAGPDAVPTPDTPMDIVSNNGVVKARHQSGLPLGYTLLDYIESTGTQYIDTGAPYKSSRIYNVDFQYVVYPDGAKGSLGARETITAGAGTFDVGCNSTLFYFYNNSTSANKRDPRDLARHTVEIDYTNSVFKFDGETLPWGAGTGAWQGTYNIYIGRENLAGSPNLDVGTVKWYSYKVYDNGALIQNFVPAKNSSNVVGMYDLVSGQFFTNAGTGNFVAGNTVSDPVEIYTDGTVETINVHGKNLFDKDNALLNTTVNEKGLFETNNSFNCSNYIPVQKGKTYIRSRNGTAFGTRFHLYDENKNWLSYQDAQTTGLIVVNNPLARYAAFAISSSIDLAQIQIELGSTTTAYEPYFNGGTATAEMLLKVGDYQDVQSIIDGVVTRNVGVKVLDGTEDWKQYSANNKIYTFANNTMSHPQNAQCLCSHFVTSSDIPAFENINKLFLHPTAARVYICFPSIVGDVPAFKQWLATQYNAGTPVIVVYPLATATTESVAGQALQVQQGDNVVEITQASLNNLELEAKYQAAVSLTIQEVQDANLDPNVQVTIN